MPIHGLGPGTGTAAIHQTETRRSEADTGVGRVSHEMKPGALARLKQALSRLIATLKGAEARRGDGTCRYRCCFDSKTNFSSGADADVCAFF